MKIFTQGIYVELLNDHVLPEQEIEAQAKRAINKYGRRLRGITINVEEDDYLTVSYDCGAHPFERIRRITGYLVGTLNRWNNGKQAEEHDRVKHESSMGG